MVLRNLLSDTPYTVTVVPVYPEGEGLRQAEKGKTREWLRDDILVFGSLPGVCFGLWLSLTYDIGDSPWLVF